MRRMLYLTLCWLTIIVPVWAAENFPPPEFSTPYKFPTSQWPLPRAEFFIYLDIVVLAAVLLLGGYLIIRVRSRLHVAVLLIFSLLYFGFYRHGCVCSVGSIQNVALALAPQGYVLPFTVAAFFLLPLLFALFLGRVFCGAACPLGAVQDIILLRPVKLPGWLTQALSVIPYIYLGVAVLFASTGALFAICKYDPFVSFFRFSGPVTILIIGGVLLLLGVFIGRPYCRFLCPYSVLLRFLTPLAKWRVRISPTTCVKCHLCADACPFGAIQAPTLPLDAARKAENRRQFLWLLLALPFLIAAGGWMGYLGRQAFVKMHPIVAIANNYWKTETLQGKTLDEVVAASPYRETYRLAALARRQFDVGTPLLGAWIGLVIGMKLLLLSRRKQRNEYEIDQASCLACGRCFNSCPVEHDRLRQEQVV